MEYKLKNGQIYNAFNQRIETLSFILVVSKAGGDVKLYRHGDTDSILTYWKYICMLKNWIYPLLFCLGEIDNLNLSKIEQVTAINFIINSASDSFIRRLAYAAIDGDYIYLRNTLCSIAKINTLKNT